MANDAGRLPVTEQQNPKTMDLDALPLEHMLRLMNDEDRSVAGAVAREIPQIAAAVEAAAAALRGGGRMVYVGAGTSGRIGWLDAVECPPTFNTFPEQVQAIVPGGAGNDVTSSSELEDDVELGARMVRERAVGPNDVVVGIAASGTTPFTVSAVQEARRLGATTVAVACVPDSPLARAAQIAITPVVGPEVIAGSTRMKAGTAQKLVLNMLSTATMVRLGKVYRNLMVEVKPRNRKLQARAERIVAQALDSPIEQAREWLSRAEGNAKVAIVMARAGVNREEALRRLDRAAGHARQAIEGSGN